MKVKIYVLTQLSHYDDYKRAESSASVVTVTAKLSDIALEAFKNNLSDWQENVDDDLASIFGILKIRETDFCRDLYVDDENDANASPEALEEAFDEFVAKTMDELSILGPDFISFIERKYTPEQIMEFSNTLYRELSGRPGEYTLQGSFDGYEITCHEVEVE